jgi:hypothetical protein
LKRNGEFTRLEATLFVSPPSQKQRPMSPELFRQLHHVPIALLFIWYRLPISTIRRAPFVVASPGLVSADLPCLKPARPAPPPA